MVALHGSQLEENTNKHQNVQNSNCSKMLEARKSTETATRTDLERQSVTIPSRQTKVRAQLTFGKLFLFRQPVAVSKAFDSSMEHDLVCSSTSAASALKAGGAMCKLISALLYLPIRCHELTIAKPHPPPSAGQRHVLSTGAHSSGKHSPYLMNDLWLLVFLSAGLAVLAG